MIICVVCDWECQAEIGDLPEDWTCPLCGAGAEMFEEVEDGSAN